jgi:AcrR family transcriptional regulator
MYRSLRTGGSRLGAPRRAPQTAQGAASRERLLAAAIELIAERGFAASSVDALCRRAGVVKTALYWHFGSKEGLLAAAVERVAGTWIDEIHEAASRGGDPLERLDLALTGMRRLVEERPEILRLLVAVASERAEHDPATQARLRAVFERAQGAIVAGMDEALGVHLGDADLVAETLLALVQAASFRRLLRPEATDLDRFFEHVRRTIALLVADRLRDARPGPPGGTP